MQRTSVQIVRPDVKLSLSGNYVVALIMARYMIGSQNCKVPMMFLDLEELNNELKEAYVYASKLNTVLDLNQIPSHLSISNLMEETEEVANLTTLVGKFTILSAEESDTACIIQFPDQGSVLLIVGHYMIDPSNGIFCVSKGPEYDIEAYARLYGAKEGYIAYFMQEGGGKVGGGGGGEEKKREVEVTPVAAATKTVKKARKNPPPPPPSAATVEMVASPVAIEQK